MAENDFRVIVKAQELAEHSFRLTSNSDRYPKKYRHSLGDRIQLKSLDIYDTLLEANTINNVTRKAERCEMITKAITYCTQLLFYIELSMKLKLLNNDSAKYWSKMVTDVKHMSIAWLSWFSYLHNKRRQGDKKTEKSKQAKCAEEVFANGEDRCRRQTVPREV